MTASSCQPVKNKWETPSTRHYIAPHRYHEDPSADTVPMGYHPVAI